MLVSVSISMKLEHKKLYLIIILTIYFLNVKFKHSSKHSVVLCRSIIVMDTYKHMHAYSYTYFTHTFVYIYLFIQSSWTVVCENVRDKKRERDMEREKRENKCILFSLGIDSLKSFWNLWKFSLRKMCKYTLLSKRN